MPIIEVDHLTKEYRLGAMQGLKQTLLNTAARLTGGKVAERPLFKALDDVNFTIEQGEVVGIIGHNGAGKSTLLKMLTRISTPTRGSIKTKGRIAPLIEVGAGFVPDFTGRENVYLNGSIMGMSRKDIDKKFDEIVTFAEMEDFIDTPVKRYSSGMQVKLAFAVATSIESEILIVDEVLAVGDLAFQRKCFDRMEQLIKREGRTVLLVSHNIRQIERICDRVMLVKHGKIIMDGHAKDVCNAFYEESDRTIISQQTNRSNINSTGEAELMDLYISEEGKSTTNEVAYKSNVDVTVVIKSHKPLEKPIFVFGIHATDFVYITTATSPPGFAGGTLPVGTHELRIQINQFPILPGVYSIRLSIDVEEPIKNILYGENLCHFTVNSASLQRTSSQCEGFFALDTHWQVKESNYA